MSGKPHKREGFRNKNREGRSCRHGSEPTIRWEWYLRLLNWNNHPSANLTLLMHGRLRCCILKLFKKQSNTPRCQTNLTATQTTTIKSMAFFVKKLTYSMPFSPRRLISNSWPGFPPRKPALTSSLPEMRRGTRMWW